MDDGSDIIFVGVGHELETDVRTLGRISLLAFPVLLSAQHICLN